MPAARHTTRASLGLILIAFVACLGCGGSATTVQGTVTFDGQPVDQGMIEFVPTDGTGPVAGGTIANGSYQLGPETRVAPGNMLVRIRAMRPTGKKIKAGPPAPEGTMIDDVQQYIPAKYNEQSTLTAQLAAGEVRQNFDLRSP
ncbi:hypothetical protein NA78x_003144 [Anatilimnocola sp. NA78]|uniref:hypothetical protein n=1 Tax=Anatilimnocola sp. NA78 TaxID=3415683 RepID=UPI003CE59074